MNVNQINAYLQQAREIIGDRSRAEIDYDNEIVEQLDRGLGIKRAIATANEKYPEEALKPQAGQWADVAARYEYLLEHKKILEKLGMKE